LLTLSPSVVGIKVIHLEISVHTVTGPMLTKFIFYLEFQTPILYIIFFGEIVFLTILYIPGVFIGAMY
jgi:hypothetical protein